MELNRIANMPITRHLVIKWPCQFKMSKIVAFRASYRLIVGCINTPLFSVCLETINGAKSESSRTP